MSSVAFFPHSKKFSVNTLSISNILIAPDVDVLECLRQHAACGAMHDSEERFPPPRCHPGTRQAVRTRVFGWYGFKTRPERGIMWVHGPAGYGKSAVAQTISDDLEDQSSELDFNPVGATFFFWRTSPERNSPARFIITLAYQLVVSVPELRPHIGLALKNNPMIVKKSLEVQLKKLIIEPFRALDKLDEMPNRLVIIDGLDECINSDQETRLEKKYAEDQERVQIRVLDLIFTLQSHNFPLSFIIFSRPEAWIQQHMESRRFEAVTEVIDLYQVEDNLHDVEVYLTTELSRIAASFEPQPGGETLEWPDQWTMSELLSKADGHMLYASIVVRHIDDPYDDPRRRLSDLLSLSRGPIARTSTLAHTSPFSALHELYRQILCSCPEEHRPLMLEIIEDVRVMGSSLGSVPSVSAALAVLDRLCGRAPGLSTKALRNLRAVTNWNSRFYPYQFFVHSSFLDFLLNPQDALEFHISFKGASARMLLRCLRFMSSIDLSVEIDLDEDHVQVALNSWPHLFSQARPSNIDEYATPLRLLLALDLKTCFIRAFKGCIKGYPHPIFYMGLRTMLYKTLIPRFFYFLSQQTNTSWDPPYLDLDPPLITLGEECAIYINSSIEYAIAHMLQPALVQSDFSIQEIGFTFQFYADKVRYNQEWDPGSDKAVQAFNLLKKDYPHIHRKFLDRWPECVPWEGFAEPCTGTNRTTQISERFPFLFDTSDDQYIVDRERGRKAELEQYSEHSKAVTTCPQ